MKVFISYSWDNELHKKWVLMLGNKLMENGVFVYLDQYDLKVGKNMNLFMEKAIEESDKVLIILTPNFKIKAENREGGVGYEYSICNKKLYENQKDNDKFIPILRTGEFENSVPNFLKAFIHHDMSNNEIFNDTFIQLLRIIYNEPEIRRPILGKRPELLFNENKEVDNNISTLNDLLREAISNIENNSKYSKITGITVGIKDFDNLTNGFQDGSLIFIGSRPTMGKTALTITFAANIALLQNKPIAFVSTEMSNIQVVNRILSFTTKIPLIKINRGDLNPREWKIIVENISRISKMPLIINDSLFKNLKDLKERLYKLKNEYNVELIIIDLLQSLRFIESGKEITKPAIIKTIYNSAKELKIPIIITSQLNKSVEMRSGNKRPQFSDIPDSETIEQLADLVLFIHRPEIYGFTQDEEGNSLNGYAEIIIAKNRNGTSGDIKLKFNDELVGFAEFENYNYFGDINKKDFDLNNEDIPF